MLMISINIVPEIRHRHGIDISNRDVWSENMWICDLFSLTLEDDVASVGCKLDTAVVS